MTTFSYVALEPSGKRHQGVVEAASKEMAISALTNEGRFVLEIKEERSSASLKAERAKGRHRASRSDMALFTRRLSDLALAGLPLDRALQVVAEQSESTLLTEVCDQALEQVRSGKAVSEALAEHPKLFSHVYTQTLKAGEASGQFGEVASRLADFEQVEVERRSTIGSALIYPAVLTTVAIGVVTFLETFVIPRLAAVFKDMGGELPAATKLLMAGSAFITGHWTAIIGGIAIAVVVYRAWAASAAGHAQRDAILLQVPLLGSIVRKAVISRFSRVLGTLVFGGVPILESLRLAGMASGNRTVEIATDRVADDVRDGKTIHQAMRDQGGFPPVLVHMVAIGEETGDLPKMLGRVSDSLDFEVDTGLKRLVAIIEPLIVLVMGTFVGFVVLSVLLPIYQAQELVK